MKKTTKQQISNIRETPTAKPRATWPPRPTQYVIGKVDNGAGILRDEERSDDGRRHPFDLLERTAQFGENIVRFSKKIPRDPTNHRLIIQVVGAGTSIGANYCEAEERVSKKDFKNTIGRCKKEAKETRFFLRMIVASEPGLAKEARSLYRECKELLLIFASIYPKMNGRSQHKGWDKLDPGISLLFGVWCLKIAHEASGHH
jgi:four helix bundle protein